MSADRLPRRQKTRPVHSAPRYQVDEACPGTRFTVAFEGDRRVTLNLAGLSRQGMAAQTAQLLWDKVQRQAPMGSPGLIDHPQAALRLFCDHLDKSDASGIQTLGDIAAPDIDAFEEYLRLRYPDSTSSHKSLGGFLSLLRDAADAGLVRDDLRPRLAYLSKLPPIKNVTPREPFSELVMANLHAAAAAGVRDAVRRRCRGQRRARHGRRAGGSLPLASEIAWGAAFDGLPNHMSTHQCNRFRSERGISVATILAEMYTESVDAVAFAILIAEDTGIPIECVRDLKADCLRNERDGLATLHYQKRRARGRGDKTMVVSTRRRSSAGWLIKLFLKLSEHARRHAPEGVGAWLFVGYAMRRILRLNWTEQAVGVFLEEHPVNDESGVPLKTAQLSRIRKNAKAKDYRRVGGDLRRFANDHGAQVAATHYARIVANAEIHEQAIENGISAALEASTRSLVQTAEGPVAQGDDVAVAQCLDFNHSPHAPPGRPCGAPLLGCLDCANAVVSEANLPALFHLLHDIVQKRQEMDLGSWVGAFGNAYARILLILDQFPKPIVQNAMDDAAASFGRSWSPAQLAYKV